MRAVTRFMMVVGACATLTACNGSAGGSHPSPAPRSNRPTASSPAARHRQRVDNPRDIARVRHSEPELGRISARRYRVLGRFTAGAAKVVILDIDHARLPGWTRTDERHFYSVAGHIAAQAKLVVRAHVSEVTPGDEVWRLSSLRFDVMAPFETVHYVVITNQQALIDGNPSSLGIRGAAVTTTVSRTASVTLLRDLGSRFSNLRAAATEACQATVFAQPTFDSSQRIQQAAQRVNPVPPDLAQLNTYAQAFAQEGTCVTLGLAMVERLYGASWASYVSATRIYVVATSLIRQTTTLSPKQYTKIPR